MKQLPVENKRPIRDLEFLQEKGRISPKVVLLSPFAGGNGGGVFVLVCRFSFHLFPFVFFSLFSHMESLFLQPLRHSVRMEFIAFGLKEVLILFVILLAKMGNKICNSCLSSLGRPRRVAFG